MRKKIILIKSNQQIGHEHKKNKKCSPSQQSGGTSFLHAALPYSPKPVCLCFPMVSGFGGHYSCSKPFWHIRHEVNSDHHPLYIIIISYLYSYVVI